MISRQLAVLGPADDVARTAQCGAERSDVDIWLTSDASEALDARQSCQLLQGDGTTAYFACSSADAETPENVPFTVTSHDCQVRLTIFAGGAWIERSPHGTRARHEHAGAQGAARDARGSHSWSATWSSTAASHEIAHFLIDEKQLPIIGPEENAADYIATLALLRDESLDPARREPWTRVPAVRARMRPARHGEPARRSAPTCRIGARTRSAFSATTRSRACCTAATRLLRARTAYRRLTAGARAKLLGRISRRSVESSGCSTTMAGASRFSAQHVAVCSGHRFEPSMDLARRLERTVAATSGSLDRAVSARVRCGRSKPRDRCDLELVIW